MSTVNRKKRRRKLRQRTREKRQDRRQAVIAKREAHRLKMLARHRLVTPEPPLENSNA